MGTEDTPIPGALNNVIAIDDERIRGQLDRVVRGTVEETLKALLDAEADRLRNAQRYEARLWRWALTKRTIFVTYVT